MLGLWRGHTRSLDACGRGKSCGRESVSTVGKDRRKARLACFAVARREKRDAGFAEDTEKRKHKKRRCASGCGAMRMSELHREHCQTGEDAILWAPRAERLG